MRNKDRYKIIVAKEINHKFVKKIIYYRLSYKFRLKKYPVQMRGRLHQTALLRNAM
jgi:hypothetical protein